MKPRYPFLKWKLCPALGGRFGRVLQRIGHVAHSRLANVRVQVADSVALSAGDIQDENE